MRLPTFPPTGTVTFLFTDIEGSTKLWEAHPDAMRRALACHDEIVRASIEANGGYVFKTVGDAFCAAFATAPEAVEAALDAQLSLNAEAWEVEPPVRARMAVHTGAAEARGGDYFGQPLNRAARLLAAGHGGQTLLSAVAQELVRDHLPAGCLLDDLGDASLKDLARPERVYQLLHPDLPREFPPLRTLSSGELPNNLPQQPTSFIGREKEIAEVEALLRKNRLLTLVGPGGAGKTRLSLQAAADLLDGEGDGVWLVELAPLSDASLVPGAVAQALGVKEAAGQTVQKSLMDALKNKTLLIVLDNCEHVIAACASLAAELLKSCPGVSLLATSREPLGVAGEQVYRIPSLSVPASSSGGGRIVTAESLTQYDSVRLFIERAQAVQPAFAVTDSNAPAVAQVCTHLDGIPLAIELAAARVRSMPVEQVNARLDQRFRLLTGGSRANLPRQQTLRALIDWSYDLLSDQEKLMLARLSVFAGGWTLEAAEAVCSGEGIDDWETLDLLTSLTDKSLVVYEEAAGAGGSARYGLLETIRQYGQERLAEGGAAGLEASRTRHRDWCIALATEAEPQLLGPEAAAWLARLEAEHDNFRASLLWCEEQPPSSGAVAGLRLAGNLARFWYVHGHYSEGRRWIGSALGQAESLPPDAAASDEMAMLRAKTFTGAGPLAAMQSDYAAARGFFQSGITLYRQIGDTHGLTRALTGLGNVLSTQSDFAGARPLYEESLEIRRRIGDESGVAYTLNGLAFMATRQNNYAAARAYYAECLDVFRKLGNQMGLANSLDGIASILAEQTELERSSETYRESLEIRRAMGDLQGISDSLNGLSYTANVRGEYELARSLLEESLQIRRDLGNQRGIGSVLGNLAEAAYGEGDYAEARRLTDESLRVSRQFQDNDSTHVVLTSFGDYATQQGDTATAAEYLGEALRMAEESGVQAKIGWTLLSLGNLATAEGDPASARASLLKSYTIVRDTRGGFYFARFLEGMAGVALLSRQPKRATTLSAAASSLRAQIGAPPFPRERHNQEQAASAARAALGEAEYAAAWAVGQAMTAAQAIEYTLADFE